MVLNVPSCSTTKGVKVLAGEQILQEKANTFYTKFRQRCNDFEHDSKVSNVSQDAEPQADVNTNFAQHIGE